MIQISKPDRAPAILRNRGRDQTAADEAEFDANQNKYLSGEKSFDIDRTIYAAKSVKTALIRAQHDKCCFCESKISHVAHGDVEHFRPKKGFRQKLEDDLGRPGYYWLAYEWNNLFFACQICNQRYKGNLFPLDDPTTRARSHNDDLNVEHSLFIHPSAKDPEGYISFREEYPFAVNGSHEGRTTIDTLGLDRETLAERRRDHLRKLEAISILAGLDLPEAADAQKILDEATQDSAEYAAMARAFLAAE